MHTIYQLRLRRTCSRLCTSTRRQVPSYASDLFIVVGINIDDLWSTHPASFCYLCYQPIDHAMCALVFDGWISHSDDVCWVCEQGRKCVRGGRPKKINVDGRPTDIPIRNLVHHIELIAPPLFIPCTEEPPKLVGNVASRESVVCPLSLEVLNSPIELVSCGSIVCSKCCCSWLEVKHELECLCCYGIIWRMLQQ